MATAVKPTTAVLASQGRVESAKNVTPVAASPAPTVAASPSPEKPKFERVRKITSKLFAKIAEGKANGVRIAGTIRSFKPRTGAYGEYFAFVGDFRLVMGTEIFASAELILPRYPESILHGEYVRAFNSMPKGVANLAAPEITFAVVIFRQKDESPANARGFTWEVDTLREMEAPTVDNDPLLKLLA